MLTNKLILIQLFIIVQTEIGFNLKPDVQSLPVLSINANPDYCSCNIVNIHKNLIHNRKIIYKIN